MGPPRQKLRRVVRLFFSALTGAAAAALVLGVAKSSGWLDTPLPKPPIDVVSKSDVDALGTRVAKIESDAAKPALKPVTDPALVARLDAVEKSLTSLRGEVAVVRGQSEKVAAALGEIKSAPPQGVIAQQAASVDTSALEERLDKIERATAALSTAGAAAPPQPPAEDPKLRRLTALIDLEKSVRRGSPYVTELAAARSVAGDADTLKALDPFAHSGVPDAETLSKELSALLPQLTPTSRLRPPALSSAFSKALQSWCASSAPTRRRAALPASWRAQHPLRSAMI